MMNWNKPITYDCEGCKQQLAGSLIRFNLASVPPPGWMSGAIWVKPDEVKIVWVCSEHCANVVEGRQK